MEQGITNVKAIELLKQHGYNELPSEKPRNLLKIALEVIKEPMFMLLIACGSLYVLLGEYTEGVILLCSVFVIIFITFLLSARPLHCDSHHGRDRRRSDPQRGALIA